MTPYPSPPILVAEVGCNHGGNLNTARLMIKAAAEAGADVVKFQKRNLEMCLDPTRAAAPHPVPSNAFGTNYAKHRAALEFTLEQHYELKRCCKDHGVAYACSVWDVLSALEVASLGPAYIKIPSACNLHKPLRTALIGKGPVHLSLGALVGMEIRELLRTLAQEPGPMPLLYVCTSSYPPSQSDLHLGTIRWLRDAGLQVGFSSHTRLTRVAVYAFLLGASVIEQHFTLDRAQKGTDHAISLLPEELKELRGSLNSASRLLTSRPDLLELCEEEKKARRNWRYLDNSPAAVQLVRRAMEA